jgi:flagellar hook protein FlgE
MSLYGALNSGVSGLNSQSQFLGIISDNISNVNTIGYKGTNARFSTLVTEQALATSFSPGGVRSKPVSSIDQQGLLQASSSPTDLAISGNGFFVVTDAASPTTSDLRSFTRAGAFHPDANGDMVNDAGFYLQGWATDSTGTPTTANTSVLTGLETVNISGIAGSATATSTLAIGANLPATAAAASTQTTNAQIIDALGVAHNLGLTWTKQATANVWRLTITDTTNPVLASSSTTDSGTIAFGTGGSIDVRFNGDGTLKDFDTDLDATFGDTLGSVAITSWTTGASNSTIALNLGTADKADGMTQFGDSYSVSFVNQNGVRFGNFTGVSVDESGIMTALFDNGENLKIYKVPLVTFPNANGLDGQTGNVFIQTDKSGDYVLRSANSGTAGKIASSTLEASTTDLATEFTNMIVAQRAYSASAKVITTADEMLDELIRIKR